MVGVGPTELGTLAFFEMSLPSRTSFLLEQAEQLRVPHILQWCLRVDKVNLAEHRGHKDEEESEVQD